MKNNTLLDAMWYGRAAVQVTDDQLYWVVRYFRHRRNKVRNRRWRRRNVYLFRKYWQALKEATV